MGNADSMKAFPVPCLLLLTLLLAATVSDAEPPESSVSGFQVVPTGSNSDRFAQDCPAPETETASAQSLSGSGLWKIRIERDIRFGKNLVLALDYPYPSDFRVALPDRASVIRRGKTGEHRDPAWPARLSVIPLPDRMDAGQAIEVCAHTSFDKPVDVEIIETDTLRARTRRETMTGSALVGTLAAMVLAGIGMTFALGNFTFVLIATGLSGALLYFMATQGAVYEIPPLARAADIWALHKIGGNLAVLALGLGLARLISLPERRPRLWRVLAVLLSAVALLLALVLVPRFGHIDATATAGNLLLLLITATLFGVSLIDGLRGHRASRVLVVAWSPPFLIASAMTFELLRRNTGDVLPELAFPAALVFSSTVMFFGLAEEIASVRSQRDTARLRADHDDLTGALARTAFDQLAASARARALAEARSIGILFIDIDRFKSVNDQLGHARGDDALLCVVERIRECLRDTDRLGRYGGEEFVVLLEDVTPETLREVSERIRGAVENRHTPLADGLPPITVSVGGAILDSSQREPVRAFIERADDALRWCKRNGRNCSHLASGPGH